MVLDPVLNFAKVSVDGGYDNDDTSITLATGDGSKLPDPSVSGAFNLVWWDSTNYTNPTLDPNVEIVRCTARSTDTLTVTRAQESTSASTKNTGGATYEMILSFTKKTYDDLKTYIDQFWSDDGTDITPSNSRNIKIPDTKHLKYGALKVPQYYDTSVLVDGGVEVWDATGLFTPDDWTLESISGDVANQTTRTADSSSGSYAVQNEAYDEVLAGMFFSNLLDNAVTFAADETIQVIADAKRVSGTSNMFVIRIAGDGVDDYYYHATGALAGTWSTTFDENIFEILIATSSYTELSSAIVTAPAWAIVSSQILIGSVGDNEALLNIDNVQIKIDGVDQATDGGFENWTATTPTTLTNWTEGLWGVDSVEAGIIRESTIIQAGTYSAKLYRTSGDQPYIEQVISGLTAGHTYRLRYYARKDGASSVNARARVALFDDTKGSASQYYNFTTNAWVSYTPATTEPASDFYDNKTLTDSFQQFSVEEFVVPASGKITVVVWIGGNNTDILYFDAADLQRNVPTNTPTLFESTNVSEFADLETNDVLWHKYLTGGTDRDIWKMILDASGNGVISTYLTALDFSTQDHIVGVETFKAVAAPTAVEGDTWNDSTKKGLVGFFSGIKQGFEGVLFTQTASATVANTTDETTLIASGTGTLTLPANFFTVGKIVRIKASGVYSETSSPNMQIQFKLGATSVYDTGTVSIGDASTGVQSWTFEADIVCRSTGATGTTMTQGMFSYVKGAATIDVFADTHSTTDIIDTTGTLALNLTMLWGTAHADNSMICTNLSIEVLNPST